MSNAKIIKELRNATGAGIMDCKDALLKSGNDIDKAKVYLRKQGIINSKSRAHKAAEEGKIGVYKHTGSRICAMVEVRCETDFVARGEEFDSFVYDIALHIAAANPKWVSRQEVPQSIIDEEESIIASGLGDKPEKVQNQIIKGKMNRFYKENCLLDQPFVKEPKRTVTDLLDDLRAKCKENINIKSFSRLEVGNG